MLPTENRLVYPYKQMYEKGLEAIDFAPITIFYGSNGSGKSTLLNIIASKVGVNNKSLGNTSEYFDGFVRKCTDISLDIPADSMFIRSEDIMELIAERRKKNASIDRTVKGWFAKGADKSTKGSLVEEMYVQSEFENIFDNGATTMNNSFYNVVKEKLFEKNDEESNGETAIDYFKERLFPGYICQMELYGELNLMLTSFQDMDWILMDSIIGGGKTNFGEEIPKISSSSPGISLKYLAIQEITIGLKMKLAWLSL